MTILEYASPDPGVRRPSIFLYRICPLAHDSRQRQDEVEQTPWRYISYGIRDNGFLPEALVNYLALLGWSYSATDTLFTVDELIRKFSLDRVSRNPAVFDIKKLEWMNGVYLREMEPDRLTDTVIPRLQREGLIPEQVDKATRAKIQKIAVALHRGSEP